MLNYFKYLEVEGDIDTNLKNMIEQNDADEVSLFSSMLSFIGKKEKVDIKSLVTAIIDHLNEMTTLKNQFPDL